MTANNPWKGKKALVLGLGLSGRSAADFLLFHGAIVTGVDQKSERLSGLPFKTHLDHIPISIQDYDFIVPSPGVPETHPYCQAAILSNIALIGEIELALKGCGNKVIGITGTNGKTTVTLLIEHVLNSCGLKAKALGNVGIPLAAELLKITDPDLILVVELSSYQIDTLKSETIDYGAILNITPDHLDRYGTMDKYAKSKIRLKDCLKQSGKLFVEEKTYREYAALFHDSRPDLYGYSKKCSAYTDLTGVFLQDGKEFQLPKELQGVPSHDLENLLAAFLLAASCGVSIEGFLEAYATFTKPKHRIEFVRSLDGVSYYDDSKGTNIDAVMRAVERLNQEAILIAGGVDKGASYLPWVQSFNGKVKAIFAIGQAAEKLASELSPHIPVEICKSLESAVKKSQEKAKRGQLVLLSPGCSSLDMFKDYAERGREFQKIVHSLSEIKKE